ncbi:MAG: fasciclin domain-containing protein [Woeseiaceae bacterium]
MPTKLLKLSSLAAILAITTLTVLPTAANAERFRPGDQTIAEIAVTTPGFTTLVAALSCTDLVGAVADPDAELTVFAPTDQAFAALGLDATNICGTFDTATLTTILLYHVVGERRPSPSVINGRNKSIEMLAGGAIYPVGQRSLTINANSSTANIVAADILASNGIIHVIDYVLLP